LYLAALFELDPDRLPQRIAEALGNAYLALDELKRIHQVDRLVA
jgi:hypothetical protein